MKPRSLSDNFKEGDLLYGLVTERAVYIAEASPKIRGSKAPLTVDVLNNKIMTVGKPKGKWSEESHANAISYLQGENASPVFENHLKIMKDTTHIKLSLTRNDYPPSPKEGLSPSVRARIRACKLAMLEYPKQNDATIHFILDKIDLQHTVDRGFSIKESKSISKTHTPRAADVLHDAYTNAELRFIFKHYDEILKNNKSIIFYQDKQEINLFAWIDQQPQAAKDAFIQYAQAKKLNNLLSEYGKYVGQSQETKTIIEVPAVEAIEVPSVEANETEKPRKRLSISVPATESISDPIPQAEEPTPAEPRPNTSVLRRSSS